MSATDLACMFGIVKGERLSGMSGLSTIEEALGENARVTELSI